MTDEEGMGTEPEGGFPTWLVFTIVIAVLSLPIFVAMAWEFPS